MASKKFDVTVSECDAMHESFRQWIASRGDNEADFVSMMFQCLMSEAVYSEKVKGMKRDDMFEALYKSYSLRMSQIKD